MYVYIIYIYYLKADVPRPMVTQIREEEKKKIGEKVVKDASRRGPCVVFKAQSDQDELQMGSKVINNAICFYTLSK